MERNELAVGVHLFPGERDRRFASQVAAPLVAAVAAAATGVVGGLLIMGASPHLDTDTGQLLQALGLGSVVVALLALVRTLIVALRRLRERD